LSSNGLGGLISALAGGNVSSAGAPKPFFAINRKPQSDRLLAENENIYKDQGA
jgi:hypothetical protein